MDDVVAAFFQVFTGNEMAHGGYTITGTKGVKKVGKAVTVKSPLTEEIVARHLKGVDGIGSIPIRQDSTCLWGAVDIDQYDGLDLEDLSMKLPAPLVLCRSKSGGAHIYVFMTQPVSAKTLRKKLLLVARAVGHPEAEVFPKQDVLEDDRFGNFINLPYFNAESTTRYCLKGGVALSVEEFLSYVRESAVNIQQLAAFEVPSLVDTDDGGEFADAPPCLEYMTRHGFPTGSRNHALFSMGVYARKKFPTGWEDKVFEYNKRFMSPGSYSEVAGIIRSLDRRSYTYKCKDQPCVLYCDKQTCYTRQYGLEPTKDDERGSRPNVLDDVTHVLLYEPSRESKDEPYWVFTFANGKKLEVTIKMTRSQTEFCEEYARRFYRNFLPIKDKKWCDSMNALIDPEHESDVLKERIELAPDSGPEGQFWLHVEEFCTGRASARAKDEILLGKPWVDKGRVYFRSGDLIKYLDQQRFRAFRETEITKALRRKGAKHHSFNLKGKHTQCWSLDIFDPQNEPFDTTEVPDDSPF